MPSYKNENNNTWFCKFYYKDWQGNQQQKKKSGFRTKKEAQAWERSFLDKHAANPDMLFNALVELYLEDMSNRLKDSTLDHKRIVFKYHILPFFKNMPINEITPATIRNWQNELIKKGLAETSLSSYNSQFSAVMNYAMKYYQLPANPVRTAGSIGKSRAASMDFWTQTEFNAFIQYCTAPYDTIFKTLYYTGMRIGELMALTWGDVDFKAGTIAISKTYAWTSKGYQIHAPKTPKSKRVIYIPPFLCDELKKYQEKLYSSCADETVFHSPRSSLDRKMAAICTESKVKKIRLHDLRHSHASLLIELGFSPLLIADRLGHEKVETTLNTYSHLYPNKQSEVVEKLQSLQI
ncbi:site-specific integrase [Aminipila butyrica]|uniref:Site-specific integrase n=1 Tax=Aminipila butyrica TaxID=433296 RepID=A0A858BPV1_9FIRM|nr:site-specific integrase [Aminipila butyrica]QIB67823.1 site-specific integrase [Aminipila butyrica]